LNLGPRDGDLLQVPLADLQRPVDALAAGPPCGTGKGELEGGPPQFTAGLPDPAAIESQKTVYTHELDDQLKQGVEVLAEQLKQQSAYLAAVGEQQKRQYGLQVDRDIKAKEMVLAQQHNEQLLMLQQAAQQQKSALEHQANALILEYQQKKTAEELAAQQFNFQKQHMEMQARYAEEMRELQVQQMAAASQVAAQQAAIAQEAAAAERQAQSMAHHHSTAMLHGARGGVPFAVPMVVGPPPVLACAGHSRMFEPATVVQPTTVYPATVAPGTPMAPGGTSLVVQAPVAPPTALRR